MVTVVMVALLVSIVFQSVKNVHATMLGPCQTLAQTMQNIANAIKWDNVIVR